MASKCWIDHYYGRATVVRNLRIDHPECKVHVGTFTLKNLNTAIHKGKGGGR